MPDLRPDRDTLAKAAGLALGIVMGGVVGPIVFGSLGMGPPAAASVGCFAGAVAGYFLASVALLIQQRRKDAELRRAAAAVMAEMRFPKTISIKIKGARATLEGAVEHYFERHEAERAVSTIPGIKEVINRIRLRPSAEPVSTSADEIRKRISEHFLRLAELDGRGSGLHDIIVLHYAVPYVHGISLVAHDSHSSNFVDTGPPHQGAEPFGGDRENVIAQLPPSLSPFATRRGNS